MSKWIVEPGQTVECIRCYVALAKIRYSNRGVMTLGLTADGDCAKLVEWFDSSGLRIGLGIDPEKCQRITITQG